MNPARLVCWIAGLVPERDDALGFLCATHADRMIAPNGWLLDDQRTTDLRLFRPAPDPAAPRPAPVAFGRSEPDDHDGQLLLSEPVDIDEPVDVDERFDIDEPVDTDQSLDIDEADESADQTPSWPPLGGFDPDDTILPDVSGPLIARAFRGFDDPPAH